MTPEQLFYNIFSSIDRQGPGCREATLRAFAEVRKTKRQLRIIDLGCGKGTPTLDLARITEGEIYALDNYQPFLAALYSQYLSTDTMATVECINSDMLEIDFPHDYFDVVWSEGAIYEVGIREALEYYSTYLKNGGYFIFSQLVWFDEHAPREIADFWEKEYPEMTTIPQTIATIREAGYTVVKHFKLPPEAFSRNYYNPLEIQLAKARADYGHDAELRELIEYMQHEIDMYKQYMDYYGYAFFVTTLGIV